MMTKTERPIAKGPHPTETAEYWRALARNERAFAQQMRGGRYGNVESIRIYEQNAAEYDARADKIEKGA